MPPRTVGDNDIVTLARGINPLTDVRSEFGDRDIRPANDIKTMHQT